MRIQCGLSRGVPLLAVAVLFACKGVPPHTFNTSSGNLADTGMVTVAAVQGDGDMSLAQASEFLTGCEDNLREVPPFGTCLHPVLHLPQALQDHARHLHIDGTSNDYSPFYLDERVRDGSGTLGRDADSSQGLEGSNVIFYSGHGLVDNFHALASSGNASIKISDFSLGDHDARYLLMLSCNVFAHGPNTSGGFSHPELFEPSRGGAVSAGGHANVFERWTRPQGGVVPLNPGLRLACGGASPIGGGMHPTEAFWYYYSQGFGPADAFLLGFYKPESVEVPLCLSRGDRAEISGLFDSRFVADSPAGGSHFFIEYPVDAGGQDSLLAEAAKTPGIRYSRQRESRTDDPAGLPVLGVDPAPTPSFLGGLDFSTAPLLSYGFRGASAAFLSKVSNPLSVTGMLPTEVDPDDICIKTNLDSGAVVLSLRAGPGSGAFSSDSGAAFLENIAITAIRKVVEDAVIDPRNSEEGFALRDGQPIEMRIDGIPSARNRSGELVLNELSHARKCRHLRLTRVFRSGSREIPLIGVGSEILFSICPTLDARGSEASDGAVDACRRKLAPQFSVSIAGRTLSKNKTDTSPAFAFPTLDSGRREAVRRLLQMTDGPSYEPKPRASRWGYKAAPAHCKQEKMYIVYEFEFAAKPGHEELPPIVIEVPAHKLPAPLQEVEETWLCAPEISGE
jgi:hypothetical protein